MLTVVTWKWGKLFGAGDVNRLRAGLERHLHLPHSLVCITDDATGIDSRVRVVPLPTTFADTPRCRRRMQIFSREFAQQLGQRLLCMDLDVVLVDDITPILDPATRVNVARHTMGVDLGRQPLVCWRVGYAGVFSGSFLLMDAGHLDGLWRAFYNDGDTWKQDIFWRRVQPTGTPSDQAALNAYVAGRDVPHWTERDGFVTYFGDGYERLEYHGVGPSHPKLPPGARIVVLGSADKAVLDEGRYQWIRDHWTALPAEPGA